MEEYRCNLPSEVLLFAVSELNEPENHRERLHFVKKLKRYYKSKYSSTPLVREDDKFFLQFLRARKFSVPSSLNLLGDYHLIREKWPELFDKVKNPNLLRNALDAEVVCPLQHRSKNGCCVFSVQYGKHNSSLLDVIAVVYLTIEHLLNSEENQVYGFIILHDLSHVTISFSTQITPSLARKLFQILDHCLPVRMKQIVFTNPPTIFTAILALFTTFADEKMRKRILVIREDYAPLYEVVHKSYLPPLYNGTGPDLNFESWKKEILNGKVS